jgi:hypothetical protein
MEGIGADRLKGVKAIAEFLGETEKRTFSLVERKLIPHGREGGRIIASKSALREHYRRLTGAGRAA